MGKLADWLKEQMKNTTEAFKQKRVTPLEDRKPIKIKKPKKKKDDG